MRKVVDVVLIAFKYIVSVFMMYAGIATCFVTPVEGSRLGFIYEYRPSLVALGVVFFAAGLTLFLGKIKGLRRIEGYGLQGIYYCFLFAGILNWYALGWSHAWGNLVGALIIGLLYLRWKYHIYQPVRVDKHRPVV